jgi:DNA-binding NtrC family response regulator
MNQYQSILILDNQSIILFDCKKFLEKKGYIVFTANKFSEAYIIFHKHPEIETIFINTSIKNVSITDLLDINHDVKIIALASENEQNQETNNFQGKKYKILNQPFSKEEILFCLE